MVKVGDMIKIIYMSGEPQYTGRTGVVTSMNEDPWGDIQLRGTWGGCGVYPNIDIVEIIERSKDGEQSSNNNSGKL